MKTLGIMLIAVMLVAAPASALVLVDEDFSGQVGADLTTKGWIDTYAGGGINFQTIANAIKLQH